jgi:hypothetical protein
MLEETANEIPKERQFSLAYKSTVEKVQAQNLKELTSIAQHKFSSFIKVRTM